MSGDSVESGGSPPTSHGAVCPHSRSIHQSALIAPRQRVNLMDFRRAPTPHNIVPTNGGTSLHHPFFLETPATLLDPCTPGGSSLIPLGLRPPARFDWSPPRRALGDSRATSLSATSTLRCMVHGGVLTSRDVPLGRRAPLATAFDSGGEET